MTENSKQNKTWTVYLHLTPSGKRYVGITSKEPINKRWGTKGQYYKNCTAFYRAIQKYGWNNIEHIILHKKLPYEKAVEKEKYYIQYYKTKDREFGYNLTDGGDGAKGYAVSTEMRQRMSDQRQGVNACGYGHYPSEETKKKMSKKGKLKVFTPETRKKMSNEKLKPVYQYTLNGVFVKKFRSASIASEQTSINLGNLCNCCRRNVKQAGGYFWSYQEIKDPKIIINHINGTKVLLPNNGRNCKPVFQLDLDRNILCKFNSIKEASKHTNIPAQSISAACKRPKSVTEKYRWKYAN